MGNHVGIPQRVRMPAASGGNAHGVNMAAGQGAGLPNGPLLTGLLPVSAKSLVIAGQPYIRWKFLQCYRDP
jgi:hypothetical protein